MKKNSSLKLILAMLIIILLCLVSIGGIYVQDMNFVKNILPKYSLGMDLDTTTIIKLDVAEETTSASNTEDNGQASEDDNEESEKDLEENSKDEKEKNENGNDSVKEEKKEIIENNYTKDDYKNSKRIIESRLKNCGIEEYRIRINENSGEIILEISDKSDASVLQNMFVVGKVTMKIVDSDGKDVKIVKENDGMKLVSNADENQDYSENDLVTFSNSSIKKVNAEVDDSYAGYLGSFVKLNMDFTEDTINKLNQIKDSYVVPKDDDGKDKEYNMEILLDGSSITNGGITLTNFLNSVNNKTMSLRLGTYTTSETEIKDILKDANVIKSLMEKEPLPVKYKINYSNDVHSNIKFLPVIISLAVIIGIMFVILIIKYNLEGAISATSILGLLALILLVIRYAKVTIAISGLIAIGVIVGLQFVYLLAVLNKNKMNSKVYNEETIKFTKLLIPVFIVSVVLPFTKMLEMSSFGMILFWGLILFEIFNNVITRAIIVNTKNK